jgi:hypothetical protein
MKKPIKNKKRKIATPPNKPVKMGSNAFFVGRHTTG